MELIGVVLSCPNWFAEAERMLDWGFENYHLEAPLTAGETACEAAVEGGMAGTVAAHTASVLFGADMVRAHDTFEAVQAARVADAIKQFRK